MPGAQGAVERREPSDADALWTRRIKAVDHEAIKEQLQTFQVPLLPLGGGSFAVQAASFLDVSLFPDQILFIQALPSCFYFTYPGTLLES